MPRSISIATVQMDVQPAPTDQRLIRADDILCDAVQLGAELVVLPELFNTGYTYSDENFSRAEPEDGPTLNWMKRSARRLGVHLAGSLLLLDQGEIFNSLWVTAPDGSAWRYDKSYPWGWERAYFRENRRSGAERAVVAQTALGDLGLLICWDVAHAELWQAYASQVDLMVICSCPPKLDRATFGMPPDITLGPQQLGAQWARLEGESTRIFETMVAEQAAWLGVPAAHGTACGDFSAQIPAGRASLLALLPGAPGLVRYLPKADQIRVQCSMTDVCQVISAQGQVLAHRAQSRGEGFILVETPLADTHPQPSRPQPQSRASRQAGLLADTYLPRAVKSIYERGVKAITR